MSFGDRVVAQIRGQAGDDRRLPPTEPNPLQRAYDDYNDMKRECAKAKHEMNELRIHNQALIAEVNMLREQVERCDVDRIRLQAVSSTLLARLLSVNAVIADAVKESIRHGIEAVEASRSGEEKTELDVAGAEARDIIERVEPATTASRLAPNEFKR